MQGRGPLRLVVDQVADRFCLGPEGVALAAVLGVDRRQGERAELQLRPAGDLRDVPEAVALQQNAGPARHDELHVGAQPAQGREVQVVVVQVRDEDGVDLVQPLLQDRDVAPAQVQDALAQDGVCHEAQPRQFEQQACVADVCDASEVMACCEWVFNLPGSSELPGRCPILTT